MDLEGLQWDKIIKESAKSQKEKRENMPDVWKDYEIVDFFGYTLQVGDRVLRSIESKYPDYISYKLGIIKKIDLTKKDNPIGILTDGKERIGWTCTSKLISQKALNAKL